MISLRIQARSFDPIYLAQTWAYMETVRTFLDLPLFSFYRCPSKIKKWTVLRSPHIDKKSREQFQLKVYTQACEVEVTTIESCFLLVDLVKQANFPGVEVQLSLRYPQYYSKNKLAKSQ